LPRAKDKKAWAKQNPKIIKVSKHQSLFKDVLKFLQFEKVFAGSKIGS